MLTLVAFKQSLVICCENSFEQEKREPWLSFNPRLALTSFRATGSRKLSSNSGGALDWSSRGLCERAKSNDIFVRR